jgi:phage tail protein X
MKTQKTTRCGKGAYAFVLIGSVAVVLMVVCFFWCPGIPPDSGPVRGKAQLLQEKRPGASTVILQTGWDLTHLARRQYGRATPTVLDMVLEANPAIKDINKIPVNQRIIMPPLIVDSFVLSGPDNRYTIHLGTYDHMPVLNAFRDESALKGKAVEIVVRHISPRERWYRAVAGPFATREEATKTLEVLDSRGFTFEFNNSGLATRGGFEK